MRRTNLFALVPIAAVVACTSARGGVILNGNFETGSFSGWTVGSTQVNPFDPGIFTGAAQVVNSVSGAPAWALRNTPITYFGGFPATPITNYTAYNGFDGSGGNFYLQQSFTLAGPLQSAILDYSWAVQSNYSGSARIFSVNILDLTNHSLATVFSYTRPSGNLPNWTPTNTSLDIASTLNSLGAGTYQLQFLVEIPQNFTGPAVFAIDNISLDLNAVPEAASISTWSLLAIIAGAGTCLQRNRRRSTMLTA